MVGISSSVYSEWVVDSVNVSRCWLVRYFF